MLAQPVTQRGAMKVQESENAVAKWRMRLIVVACVVVATLAGCSADVPAPRTFVKLDPDGAPLTGDNDTAGAHHCVRDDLTGLVWTVEQGEPGLLYHGATYSWFSNDRAENMTDVGVADGGDCLLARCDTDALVQAVNAARVCGRHDWRLPAREESLALGDLRRIGHGATLDPAYFPDAVADEYWTGSTFTMYPQGAWAYDARYGHDRVDWKANPKRVRLVSGPRRY
jgi:hypothetical protein